MPIVNNTELNSMQHPYQKRFKVEPYLEANNPPHCKEALSVQILFGESLLVK